MLLVVLVGGAPRAEAATFSRMTLRTDTLLANLDSSDFTGRSHQHVPHVLASKTALRRTNSSTATRYVPNDSSLDNLLLFYEHSSTMY